MQKKRLLSRRAQLGALSVLLVLAGSFVLALSTFGHDPPAPAAHLIALTRNWDIYLMTSGGTVVERVTDTRAADVNPCLSPDGTKIVFNANGYDARGGHEIYLLTKGATGWTRDRLTNNPAADIRPEFSPDGSKIVFQSQRDGNDEIYVMNTDGTDQVRLTMNLGTDRYPTWSADGTQIYFSSDLAGDEYDEDIWRIDADGSNRLHILERPGYQFTLACSPDGTKLAFSSSGSIFVLDLVNGGLSQLTTGDNPSWRPHDGAEIVFARNSKPRSQIWKMNADGTGQKNISNSRTDDWYPSWDR